MRRPKPPLILVFLVVSILCDYLSAQDPIRRWEIKSDEEIDQQYGDYASSRGSKAQRIRLEKIKIETEDASRMPDQEAIPTLVGALRKLCDPGFMIIDRIAVYDHAQSLLLAIPGHARYYGDKVKAFQRELEGSISDAVGSGKRYEYNQSREIWISALKHMQSPEGILILGDFLYDEKDTPPPPVPGTFEANCDLACRTFTRIGLRDSPQVIPYTISPHDRDFWREWYKEVKAGRRTFSFIGKSVEYRFNQDGTWETIAIANPPNDGKPPVQQTENIEASLKPRQQSESPERPRGFNPWWLASIGILLFAAVGLWLRTRGRRPA